MPEHDPLIRRVLGTSYLELGLMRLTADEAASDAASAAHPAAQEPARAADRAISVRLSICERKAGTESVVEVEGAGAGLVHATYAAVLSRYGREYQSLHSIQVVEYAVIADVAGGAGRGGSGSATKKSVDAVGEAIGKVTIEALNSEGRRFTFGDSSRSVTASTARAVLAMVQYFLNAERAFITLDHARRDAIERGREDLVSRYTAEMAEVVESTSYAEVIEAIRKRMPAPK
jgi:hypothetical protein